MGQKLQATGVCYHRILCFDCIRYSMLFTEVVNVGVSLVSRIDRSVNQFIIANIENFDRKKTLGDIKGIVRDRYLQ